jgi:hypothetical protein
MIYKGKIKTMKVRSKDVDIINMLLKKKCVE